MDNISIISLSKMGVKTSEWLELPDSESLKDVATPMYLGVLYNDEDTVSSIKLIDDKDELLKYYNKLKHAYGADVIIVGIQKYKNESDYVKLTISSDKCVLEGKDVQKDNIRNLSSIVDIIRQNVTKDFGEVSLKCLVEDDSDLRVIGAC